MHPVHLVVGSYFDGAQYHHAGPYTLTVQNGFIGAICAGETVQEGMPVRRAGFLMPGLAEAHCHLFLDGAEHDLAQRAAYLDAPREAMLAVGRDALRQYHAAGVTLVRDAGDIHGINVQLRDEQRDGPGLPKLLCAGKAIRNAGRYGSFMAQELTDQAGLEHLVRKLATTSDQIKILMTGIIDFEAGEVKGAPQFTLDQTRRIVNEARSRGLRTFAHCSGEAGISVALAAGIDSIEHGFFVTRKQLQIMADKGVTWVPTFSPVFFQWSRPEIAGWSANTVGNLERILDDHRRQLEHAYRIGVPVLVGSDAGSLGVVHGTSCIDELILMAGAGITLAKVLHSATVLPRAIWGCEPVDIAVGRKADLLLLEQSPFDDLSALHRPIAVVRGACSSQPVSTEI